MDENPFSTILKKSYVIFTSSRIFGSFWEKKIVVAVDNNMVQWFQLKQKKIEIIINYWFRIELSYWA